MSESNPENRFHQFKPKTACPETLKSDNVKTEKNNEDNHRNPYAKFQAPLFFSFGTELKQTELMNVWRKLYRFRIIQYAISRSFH